jgi:hypothetical protein
VRQFNTKNGRNYFVVWPIRPALMADFIEEEQVAGRNYYIDLFTGFTWDEFKKAGGNISGFRESR